MFSIFCYTLETAVLSTLLAAIIGISVSFFTSKRQFFGRKLLLSLTTLPLCIPSLIVALAYVCFFGANGAAAKILRFLTGDESLKLTFLYTTTGVVIAQGFYNFPYVMGIMTKAWSSLSDEQENSARLLGAGEFRIFFSITLKRLGGAIAAACIPVFLFCFFSFMIVLLFSPAGHTTMEVEIYHTLRTTLNFTEGAWLAVLETVTALAVVVIYIFLTKRFKNDGNDQVFDWHEKPQLCKALYESKKQKLLEAVSFAFIILLIVLFFICPMLGIIKNSFTIKNSGIEAFSLENYKRLFSSVGFGRAALNSLITALCTGFLCTLIAFLYSITVLLKRKQNSLVLQTLPLLPMAISSVVISWLCIMIFHRGNVFMLICLEVVLFWPVAWKQIQNGINSIPIEVVNAAAIFSKNTFDSIRRVYLVYCRRYLIASFASCFCISLGDASLPLVLSIPNFNTLALTIYKLAGTYRFNQSCASACILGGICIIISFYNYNNDEKDDN